MIGVPELSRMGWDARASPMRIKDHGTSIVLWLSADDTDRWATEPGKAWPCSTLRGKRLVAAFDRNGLYDLSVNGKDAPDDLDCHEFNALTSDLLVQKLTKDHPCYFVTVGQFRSSDPS